MSNSGDAKTEEIIEAVTERSGFSRDIVKSVVQHIQSVVGISNATPMESPQKARTLPEIRFELIGSNTALTHIDRNLLSSNKSKLGGIAEWIHDPRTPVCCGRLATFYAQVDTNLGPDISIVDAGVLYVFVCDHCLATFAELQYH